MESTVNRKKEVIDICLDHFVENGLLETSTRSLSNALKLQNAGLYYYFASKDEAVLLCAEAAAIRLEQALISPAIMDLGNIDLLMERLQSRADEMAPTMRFFVSVCTNKRYMDGMKPILDKLDERYDQYAEIIANRLDCKKEDIEPYVYMMITAVANYMIFAEDVFVTPQMKIAKDAIQKLVQDSEVSRRKR